LKEVVKQCKEENSAANNTVARYKEALKLRKSSSGSPTKGKEDEADLHCYVMIISTIYAL